jgi:hypothetical protein
MDDPMNNPKPTAPLLRILATRPAAEVAAPRRSLKFVAATGVLAGGLAVLPLTASAAFFDYPWLTMMFNTAQKFLTDKITENTNILGDKTERAVVAAGAGVQAEVSKATTAQIQSDIAIAEAKMTEDYRQQVLETRRKLEQPATTCQTAKSADALSSVDPLVRAGALSDTSARVTGRGRSLKKADGSTSPVTMPPTGFTRDANAETLTSYDYTSENFCGPLDKERGRCTQVSAFPNGDTNAGLLFTGTDGSDTYAPNQDVAVTAFINRIVSGMPAELLSDPKWDRTPQGKVYIEQVRRYAAFVALSAHSMNSIANNRRPVEQLGTRVLGSQAPRANMSRAEVVSEFVKAKFSAKSVADMATAEEPQKILRDMAQTNSMRLAMELEALRSAERSEALAAAQLSLLAEAQLGTEITRAQSRVTAASR